MLTSRVCSNPTSVKASQYRCAAPLLKISRIAVTAQANAGGVGAQEKQALWELYRDAPDQFFDNRNNKKSERAPDFKHKTSGQALWVDSRDTPSWVYEQLGTTPSASSPPGAAAPRVNFSDMPQLPAQEAWERLQHDITGFTDYRGLKIAGIKSEKHPDLILEFNGTRTPLWIDWRNTPDWVPAFLEGMPPTVPPPGQAPRRTKADLLADYHHQPDKWDDFREDKAAGLKNPRFPDLKHRETGEAIWLS